MTDNPSPLPPPIPFPLPAPPPPSVVILDSPCRKCGYNLRGLSTDGRCPECGTIVGVSVMGDLLRYSDPIWLRQLARGMGMLLLGTYISIGVGFIGGVLGVLLHAGILIILIGAVAGGALSLIGTWLFTAPDPSGVGEDKYGDVRKIVRVALAINIANSLLASLPQLIVLSLPIHQLVVFVQLICGFAGIVGTWAQLDYLAGLAARLPDEKIIGRAKMLRTWLTTVNVMLYILGAAVSIAQVFGHANPIGGLFMGLGCSMGVIGLASLGLLIVYLIMLHTFRGEILTQAALADSIWSPKPAPG